ncbi:hypothetical protein ACF3DV_02675 [Chlorogloeopsis fritschii PCC 9212]|uniref:Uncharacterized protein n=1 Tax=Chlorogloeopsis fritschii PCC 6912 TaxID=211165 RepID=A0A433N6L1_CHLFR|nr:hypothetical protein [Chlorogloeopsis fritschii]MBF2009247.1 hypothetical protein [Chlorogloeopsis fritschii C42_A2020_084]RUR77117.1 hypothetical protein PCC6912_40760 [Chlorogloeopsis fritschii PCC 6912]
MNSDLMPSPESSNSTNSGEAQINQQTTAHENVAAEVSQPENSPDTPSNTANDDANLANRQHPIPPPSEPMQYRAIGLVRGRYIASSEQFTQGVMVTADGTKLDAVLLGRIMSLVKNHLDLEQEHLWVVYPRTRQENDNLHLQIVGVWEPENLAKAEQQEDLTSPEEPPPNPSSSEQPELTTEDFTPSTEIPDGGFSVRGEIVYQSYDTGNLVIKIKQSPRKPNDKPKYFKLKLKGSLDAKAVGKFWDLQVMREGECLVIEHGEAIANLPKKGGGRRPPFRGGRGRPGGAGGRKPYPPRKPGETPRPNKKVGDSLPTKPTPKGVTPKPVKRPKPPEQ